MDQPIAPHQEPTLPSVVYLLVSHPDTALAKYTLNPKRVVEIAGLYGKVVERLIWFEPQQLQNKGARTSWTSINFQIQVTEASKTKSFRRRGGGNMKQQREVSCDIRMMGERLALQHPGTKKTVVLLMGGKLLSEYESLLNALRRNGIRSVVLTVNTPHGPLLDYADEVIHLEEAMKTQHYAVLERKSTSMVLTPRRCLFDEIEANSPHVYALIYDLLRIETDLVSTARSREAMRQRFRHEERRPPDIVLAMIAYLRHRPLKRETDTLVPRERVCRDTDLLDIPQGAVVSARNLLLEEGSLVLVGETGIETRYQRDCESPVHEFARDLWVEIMGRRGREKADRVVAAFEVFASNPEAINDQMKDEIKGFLNIQQEHPDKRHKIYTGWGLYEKGISDLEQRVREILEEMREAEPESTRMLSSKRDDPAPSGECQASRPGLARTEPAGPDPPHIQILRPAC